MWLDLEFARKPDVPKRVEHRLTVDIGPGHPELGRLLAEVREKQLQDELTTPGEAREWVKEQIPK